MARFETIAEAAGEYRLDLRSLLNDLRMAEHRRPRRRTSCRSGRRQSGRNYEVHEAGP
jgi:hypothetical protein